MILTVTPNPSLDRTVELPAPLAVGQVQRAAAQHSEPGGKGVNITRALAAAGESSLALLPGDPGDPVLLALEELEVRHEALPIGAALRTNITITDPAGTTTKINEPGPALVQDQVEALAQAVIRRAGTASWTALAGSLPPGVPETFYADVISRLRSAAGEAPHAIAVDASGPALAHAAAAGPDLIKPNAEELLELHRALIGPEATPAVHASELEGDRGLAVELVRRLQTRGVRSALVTLGPHGAVLIPEEGSSAPVLAASGPPLVVRSTVGAGDASLAGYLLAAHRGGTAEERLLRAAAQGRAAASLPGSTMPRPHDLRILDIVVEHITPTK
ncbi:1-phosphofructokinase family hexose kinase [Nesterenkonia sp. NBAIMH1]|uniref:1-phosphofructokinase family hexose kinase n=1 Tax=Nesterenkonia sp. NBAIMH1 TaxID=2600320 RepID=UPI0011B720C3|nr:1-phosphofructokinase family hexose kinase [Nesterenkonia sp. NBAIMH1]